MAAMVICSVSERWASEGARLLSRKKKWLVSDVVNAQGGDTELGM